MPFQLRQMNVESGQQTDFDFDRNTGQLRRRSWAIRSVFSFFSLQWLRSLFLPVGYPDSVTPDYFTFQLWDTLQVRLYIKVARARGDEC